MGTVVLDSTNLDAVIADARGETPPPTADAKSATPDSEKSGEPVAIETKPDDKDDAEGEDGLTPRQKRELTHKIQAAIGKKHKAQKDAEEFAEEQYNMVRMERQRAEKLEAELAKLRGAEKPDEETKEPQPGDFQTTEAYLDAKVDWRLEQKLKARDSEAAQQREADRQAGIAATAVARLNAARTLVPDFDAVVSAADIAVPSYIASAMQESELFAELGYHFAQHPEALEKIANLPPAHALVALGKIEGTLSSFAPVAKDANGTTPSQSDGLKPSPTTDPGPSKPRVSAPIQPLNSGSAVQVEKDEREMTAREALESWQKRKGTSLTRRQRH